MAQALGPSLDANLKQLTPDSHWKHRELTHTVDAMLSDLGLCISFAGEPAVLVSERDVQAGEGKSNYAILTRGKRRDFERRVSSFEPPALNLVVAPDGVNALLDPVREKANRNFERNWGVR